MLAISWLTQSRDYKADSPQEKLPLRWDECHSYTGLAADLTATGPASVAAAIDALGANRIAHGVLAITDPELVDRLASEQVCLDVCPTSNIWLSVFPSIAKHPLPDFLDAGVPCSLGSDDPLLFGSDLLEEDALCRAQMALNVQQLAALANASFQHSGALESADEPIDHNTAAEKGHDRRQRDERRTQPGAHRAEFSPYQEIPHGAGIDRKQNS